MRQVLIPALILVTALARLRFYWAVRAVGGIRLRRHFQFR